ncbi:MAG: hypothetical protein ACOX2S_02495 [bacterium]
MSPDQPRGRFSWQVLGQPQGRFSWYQPRVGAATGTVLLAGE